MAINLMLLILQTFYSYIKKNGKYKKIILSISTGVCKIVITTLTLAIFSSLSL